MDFPILSVLIWLQIAVGGGLLALGASAIVFAIPRPRGAVSRRIFMSDFSDRQSPRPN